MNANQVITAPISIEQDIKPVLGIDGTFNYIIANASINKCAKHKAFRSALSSFDSEAARESARKAALYGFSPDPSRQSSLDTPVVQFSGNTMSNVDTQFIYYRPNGTPYWNRALDFDGYNHRAVYGFMLELRNLYYNTVNGGILYFGFSAVPGYDSMTCLCPQDILATQHGDMMVGLLFSCPSVGVNKYFVSSGKTLNELKGTVGVVLFSGQSVPAGVTAAEIPALANEWKGKNVTVAAVLARSVFRDPSRCYNFNSEYANCYSLELTKNIDRVTVTVTQDTSGMDMNKLTVTRSLTPTGTKGTIPDWTYYNALTALGIIVSANSSWSPTPKTLYYRLVLDGISGAFVPDYNSMAWGNIVDEGTVSLASSGSTVIGHSFPAAQALKVATDAGFAKMTVSLTLSTEPNGGGLKKVFTDTITLGTW